MLEEGTQTSFGCAHSHTQLFNSAQVNVISSMTIDHTEDLEGQRNGVEFLIYNSYDPIHPNLLYQSQQARFVLDKEQFRKLRDVINAKWKEWDDEL